jgi:hypothetical protein
MTNINVCKKEYDHLEIGYPKGTMLWFPGDCPEGWSLVREVDDEELERVTEQYKQYRR